MSKREKGFFLFDDWFYLIIIVLLGFGLTLINLGWIDRSWLDYWPILLIIIGIKEFIERN